MTGPKTYYAWKHKHTNAILCSDFHDNFDGGLYETKEKAFKDFRSLIGNQNICETLQDEYRLVRVEETQKEPSDFSDCINCSWGIMRLDRDNWYQCDECGYTEFHN